MNEQERERSARRQEAIREERVLRASWSTHLLAVEGVVYVVDCAQYTKIGFTSGPAAKRIEGLKGANPFEMKLVALMPGQRQVERRLHKEFARWRHRYEWFLLSPAARKRLEQRVSDLNGVLYGDMSFLRPRKGPDKRWGPRG